MLALLRRALFVLAIAALFGESIFGESTVAADEPPAYQPGPLLSNMLEGPMCDVEEIIFAVRVPGRDHWYVTFGYYSCDYGPAIDLGYGLYPDGKTYRGYGDGGQLCRLNLRTGELTRLIDDPKGGVRDPQMHYSGEKILFSYRKGDSPTFHLYEINIDGSGLTQLTDGPDDDIEPTYLPDGGIMFCSSRCRRFVNCWYTRVAALYRCEADGSGIRMISSNNDHDNTPWVLPDGRVLYMRWEYVDRSQVHFHHLWTVNPDGTGQMTWYGNEFGGIAMLDAKPIRNSHKVVASFSPGHGRPEHLGHVAIVDPKFGPDDLSAYRNVSKRPDWKDPYAFSEDCFLVADRRGIHVMDGEGNTELIYQLPEDQRSKWECHEPRPMTPRPRERVIPSRVDLTQATGRLYLADIYHGRKMPGVERGEVKKLLVLEQLPMPVHFSGGMEAISIDGTFTLARILGTVPVEEDGSAFFEVPALRSLFFVALDENDMAVKRMQSFVTVQPGETTGCVGCHEQRTETPRTSPVESFAAFTRTPSRIEPCPELPTFSDGYPAPMDFRRDIQPILDRHCVACHNPDRPEGGVQLVGDHAPRFTVSYLAIRRHNLVADGRNQPFGNRPPRDIGSSASRLMQLIDGSHHDVKLSAEEHARVRLWIESSATYPGTYASLGGGDYIPPMPWNVVHARCGDCHLTTKNDQGVAVWRGGRHANLFEACNLTRPEKSMMLMAPLAREAGGLERCRNAVFASTDDPDYQRLLAAVGVAAEALREGKRFDMSGFRPNKHWIREMQRFGFLPEALADDAPIDYYEVDHAYWKSFWWRPRQSAE